MIYKDFQNLRLPMLGFGSMRLPLLPGGGDGDVDEAAVAEMVALAMERGANYFDTAYGYHNGNSERVMGRVLSRYPRESWLLASKFPGYDVSNIRPDRVEAIFEEQLEKCGVDYFDFYLFHNVYERNVGPYLDPDNRVLEYLLRQKEAGRIRHLGFSAHGNLDTMRRFLEAYGKDMEFCQIQLNWLDWEFQDARAKVDQVKPDVMTLDVEMPGMNGIDFLKQLLPVVPLPVILVSSLDLRVFDALSAGAVDFVRKPEPGKNDAFIHALIGKVITAKGAHVRPRPGIATPPAAPPPAPLTPEAPNAPVPVGPGSFGASGALHISAVI